MKIFLYLFLFFVLVANVELFTFLYLGASIGLLPTLVIIIGTGMLGAYLAKQEGLKSWNRIKASMLHMPVLVLSEDSGDVPVGDALIAGSRVGVFPDLPRAAEQIIHVAEVVEPDPAWEAVYDRLYPFYVQMYQHLDEDLRQLKQTLQTMHEIRKGRPV